MAYIMISLHQPAGLLVALFNSLLLKRLEGITEDRMRIIYFWYEGISKPIQRRFKRLP
jgi:hypothetical protein